MKRIFLIIFFLILITKLQSTASTVNNNCEYFCTECDRSTNNCTHCAKIDGIEGYLSNGRCSAPDYLYFKACPTVARKDFNSFIKFACLQPNQITSANIISNCRLVDANNNCIYCLTTSNSSSEINYYLSGNQCIKYEKNNVQFCGKYSSTQCTECVKFYTLNDQNNCILHYVDCENKVLGLCSKCFLSDEIIQLNRCVVNIIIYVLYLKLFFYFLK